MGEQRLAYGRARLDRAAGADGPLTFVASTTGMNRYGYSLRNGGWRLDNFNANPVVLWMHNPYLPPIARGRAVSKEDQVLLDEVVFDPEDQLARSVESKYRRGFLNAVSVGWDFVKEDGSPVLDWWRLTAEQMRDETFYDLCEVSGVSVPGDPGALVKQSRLALRNLGQELVDLFDEQEQGSITQGELRAAVQAELTRLGIPFDGPDGPSHDSDESVAFDQEAARSVLAAFDLQKEETPA